MNQFEYHVETLALTDKWSAKKHAEKKAKLIDGLNPEGQ